MITVITPVYNSEKYLHSCIQSILKQTWQDFELILVNDGSSDESGTICDEYASKDSRIKTIHKQNGGVSSARNLGLLQANGNYVTFIDSDDYITDNFLFDLYKEIENQKTDIVVQSLKKFDNENIRGNVYNNDSQKLNIKEFLSKFNITLFGFVAGKLYDFKIIKRYNITFDERMSFGEDCKFFVEYLQYCDTLYLSKESNYFYRVEYEGLTHKKLNYENEFMIFLNIKNSLNNLLSKLGVKDINQIHFYTKRLILSIFQDNTIRGINKRMKKISYLLKNHRNEVLGIYKFSKYRGKILYFLLKYNQLFLFDIAFRKLR